MKTFQNKVVWIVGASSGFGEAMARSFAAQGAKLILSARRQDALEKLKSDIRNAVVLPMDMEQSDTFWVKTNEAIAAYGHIDYLVLNAGIAQKSFAQDTTLDVEHRIMQVDYFSYTDLTRCILPYFKEQKSGHIVVVSGLLAHINLPGRTSYAAAKSALLAYYGCLRGELKSSNIDITLLIPGGMATDLVNKALDKDGNALNTTLPKGGCSVEKAAHQALNVIRKKKFQKYIGNRDKAFVMWKIGKLYPNFVAKQVLKKM